MRTEHPLQDELENRLERCRVTLDSLRQRLDARRHARELALLERRLRGAREALDAARRAGPLARTTTLEAWQAAEEATVLLADACWWVEDHLTSGPTRVA